jgi:succinoglycan biosynthesis transport protein ExoP
VSTETADTGITLRERLAALRRHRRLLLAILAVGVVLTLLVTVSWPPTYRATATILIEQQEIPQDVVRSTITSFADQRIQMISQRVMTSQNLLSIVERYNLYPWQRRTRAREVVIERMRDDIKMRLISANVMDPRSGRPMQATIAFTVAYESGSPDLALKVANELTSLYLNENVTSRTKVAEQTQTFLSEEASRLSQENQAMAEKLASFKQKHV